MHPSIPAELRRRVLISTSDGASLFRGTEEAGALQEVMEYRAEGPSAPRRGLPEGEQGRDSIHLLTKMHRQYLSVIPVTEKFLHKEIKTLGFPACLLFKSDSQINLSETFVHVYI